MLVDDQLGEGGAVEGTVAALDCGDLRVASRTARFAHPERAFGDVVYGPLHDLVGGALARELTMGGRSIETTNTWNAGELSVAEQTAKYADLVSEGSLEQLDDQILRWHPHADVDDLTGEAAIGPRGLSGPTYRGHVFWDADVFVLPFLAATCPAAARAMLRFIQPLKR